MVEHGVSYSVAEYILIIGFVLVFIIGVCGNALVIYVIKQKNDQQNTKYSSMSFLLTILAIMDLVSSMAVPMLYIYWIVTHSKSWHFGAFGCSVLPSFSSMTVTMSLCMILLITIDRCRAICKPFKQRRFTRCQLKCAVVGIILLSALCEIPHALSLTVLKKHNVSFTCQNKYDITFKNQRRVYSIQEISNDTNATYTSIATVNKTNSGDRKFDIKNNTQLLNVTIINDKNITEYDNFKGHRTYFSNITRVDVSCSKAKEDFNITSCVTLINNESIPCTADQICVKSCAINSTHCTRIYTIERLKAETLMLIIREGSYLLILFISIYLIYKELYDKECSSQLNEQTLIDRKGTLILLVAMAIIFVTLTFPKDIFYVTFLISWWKPLGYRANETLHIVNEYLKLLQACNSVCNVFIYAKLHSSFKIHLLSISQSARESLRNSFRMGSLANEEMSHLKNAHGNLESNQIK